MKYKFIYWGPRIIAVIFIIFLFLMSLDIFEENISLLKKILALFIHNIPTLTLLLFLIISHIKKKEWLAGITLIFSGIFYALIILIKIIKNGFEWYYLIWILQISGIAILTGILFYINWKKK